MWTYRIISLICLSTHAKNINKWLNKIIQLHFITKNFSMAQRHILRPHNHLLKTPTTTGDICELSSPWLVQSASWLVCKLSSLLIDQSARCPVRELAIRELAYPRVVQLPSRSFGLLYQWTRHTVNATHSELDHNELIIFFTKVAAKQLTCRSNSTSFNGWSTVA